LADEAEERDGNGKEQDGAGNDDWDGNGRRIFRRHRMVCDVIGRNLGQGVMNMMESEINRALQRDARERAYL
jgi:hypothetical protein